ncbi:MAG: response regulator [Candidatus Pseudobacter hemicellulosilyticus]|uniref:Response regulator n=1 Tax=Candidatus Pseudobacter hemicellulosilyticus TaxID=3121375 RepID=A0AAJ6BF92_9BACT|nr:MAG: response regulator [Pseudobacter sp.]
MAGYRRLLLAEDDEDDKMIFTEIMQSLDTGEPIRFDAVDNGAAVLQLLENCQELPHLVVLDQNMPQLSGRETLEILKADERFRDIPVVIYSTYNDSRISQECVAMGADQILTKPDSFEGLSEMIRDLVSRYLAK